jgi:DNA-binding winged helix-turn-helix (wHTH) protein/TolB-like protein/tetratricopeptide (TPR) repeat protein
VKISSSESAVYEFGDFRLDAGKRLLWHGGEVLALTPKVLDTLLYLVKNGGKTVGKDELMAAIWPDTVVEENNLNKNISVLRQSLGEKPGEHRFIATVPGKGYRFVATVVEVPEEVSDPEPVTADSALPESVRYQAYSSGWGYQYRGRWILAALALTLIVVAVYLWRSRLHENAAQIRSMAVLPFSPISMDTRNQALELGMADSLITQLSKANDIIVRPFSETRKYAGTDRNPVAIGRDLRVDAILDGSIQADGDHLRVTARLIRTSDGKQIWTSNFDEQTRSVFAVQDSITERVAVVLNASLGKQSRKHYTEDVESYQFFVLGRYTGLKLTPQDHAKAIEYFKKAIEKDPNYALAYAGITTIDIAYTLANDASPVDTMPEAKMAALKAAQIDDELSDAHVALGKLALFYDWDWPQAERQFLRAYDLDPNDSEGLLFLAHFYSNVGKHEKALELGERARKLDPLTINRNALLGQFLLYAGRPDEAIETLRQTIELNPNHWLPRMFIARAYIEKGMFREAIASCSIARQFGSSSLELTALEGWSYAKLGDERNARAALTQLEQTSKIRYVPPYLVALVHNALGETDLAISQLEEGYKARDMRMVFLKVDPKWNNLRSEPRFVALMKKMKFV